MRIKFIYTHISQYLLLPIIICFNFHAVLLDYAKKLRDKSLNHHHTYIHELLIVETMHTVMEVEEKGPG